MSAAVTDGRNGGFESPEFKLGFDEATGANIKGNCLPLLKLGLFDAATGEGRLVEDPEALPPLLDGVSPEAAAAA